MKYKPPPPPSDPIKTALQAVRREQRRSKDVIDQQAGMIETQKRQIEQLQAMVAQLITRGRIPCQGQSCSSEHQSPSSY